MTYHEPPEGWQTFGTYVNRKVALEFSIEREEDGSPFWERKVRKRCLRDGHNWKQKVWGQLGTDICARRGCEAVRTNPNALPPPNLGEST